MSLNCRHSGKGGVSELDRSGRAGAGAGTDKRWPLEEIPPSSTFHQGRSTGLGETIRELVSESLAGEEYGRTWMGPEREKTHVPLNTSRGLWYREGSDRGTGSSTAAGQTFSSPPPSDTRLTFGPSGLEGREGDYAQALTTWTPPLLPPHQACPGCDSCFHVFSGQR